MGFKEELEELKAVQEMLKQFGGEETTEITSLINDLENIEKNGSISHYIETFFTNDSDNEDPSYAKEGDSGFDLRAFIDSPVTLKPLERVLIPTGLKFEVTTTYRVTSET